MIFRKISDKELRCRLSGEEIRAQGLKVTDLLVRSDKTLEFFEYLVQEAREETGFEKTGPMSVEGVLFQDNLELIFRNIDEESLSEAIDSDFPEISMPKLQDALEDIDESSDGVVQLMQVSFESFDSLLSFCSRISFPGLLHTMLYREENGYILLIDLDECNKQQLGALCMLVNEYAHSCTYGDLQASWLLEHGDPICEDPLWLFAQL